MLKIKKNHAAFIFSVMFCNLVNFEVIQPGNTTPKSKSFYYLLSKRVLHYIYLFGSILYFRYQTLLWQASILKRTYIQKHWIINKINYQNTNILKNKEIMQKIYHPINHSINHPKTIDNNKLVIKKMFCTPVFKRVLQSI